MECALFIFGTIATIMNAAIMVLYVRMRGPQRQKLYNLILLHQSIVDGVSCASLFIIGKSSAHFRHEVSREMLSVCVLSNFSTIYNFTITSIERWLSITKPLYHRTSVTRGRLVAGFTGMWLAALATAAVYYLSWLYNFTLYFDIVSHICIVLLSIHHNINRDFIQNSQEIHPKEAPSITQQRFIKPTKPEQ